MFTSVDDSTALGETLLKNLKKEEEELKLKVEYKFSKEGKEKEVARRRATLEEIGIM